KASDQRRDFKGARQVGAVAAAAILHVQRAAVFGLCVGIDAIPDRDAGLGAGGAQRQNQEAYQGNFGRPHGSPPRTGLTRKLPIRVGTVQVGITWPSPSMARAAAKKEQGCHSDLSSTHWLSRNERPGG